MLRFNHALTGTDRYGITIDEEWLEGEEITNAVVTAPDEVACTDVTIEGNSITFLLAKNGANSRYSISLDIQTPTRSDRYTIQITLADAQTS